MEREGHPDPSRTGISARRPGRSAFARCLAARGRANVASVARVGLATALIRLLGQRAIECGITDFTALFLPSNRPVAELAHEGHARVVIKEGAANLYAPLAGSDPMVVPRRPGPRTWRQRPRGAGSGLGAS